MKTQVEEIAKLAEKAKKSQEDYKAKREAVLAEGLTYDEFLSKTRDLMCEQIGAYQFFIQAIAQWAELATEEA